jgi:hypothetical protein
MEQFHDDMFQDYLLNGLIGKFYKFERAEMSSKAVPEFISYGEGFF